MDRAGERGAGGAGPIGLMALKLVLPKGATHSIPNLSYPMAMALLKRSDIDAADFVTHTFPLRGIAKALQTAENDKERFIKVVVTMDATSESR